MGPNDEGPADDGGRPPELRVVPRRAPPPSPWAMIGVAVAVGFVAGWLTGE
ncbi:MAG TPA: hypothetical protein VH092_01520 [Urbifossiella sp.]|nr:hypothetical protein [Urbifossiella sp.]